MRTTIPYLARTALLALGVALAATIAAAQQQNPESLPQQVTLTPHLVEGFLDSYAALDALSEDFEREYGNVDVDPHDPTAALLGYSRYADARERMQEALEEHGMGSLEQWSGIAYSVMIAYSFAEQSEEGLTIDGEMNEALAQIEDDPNLSAEQKAQMAEMLQRQRDALGALRPPAENVEVVKPYMDRIRETIED